MLVEAVCRFLTFAQCSSCISHHEQHSLTCRFEVEDATPILYVYEVQLAPAVQRKGLGTFLMTLLKLVAKKSQLEAIMLTVLNVSICVVYSSDCFA